MFNCLAPVSARRGALLEVPLAIFCGVTRSFQPGGREAQNHQRPFRVGSLRTSSRQTAMDHCVSSFIIQFVSREPASTQHGSSERSVYRYTSFPRAHPRGLLPRLRQLLACRCAGVFLAGRMPVSFEQKLSLT